MYAGCNMYATSPTLTPRSVHMVTALRVTPLGYTFLHIVYCTFVCPIFQSDPTPCMNTRTGHTYIHTYVCTYMKAIKELAWCNYIKEAWVRAITLVHVCRMLYMPPVLPSLPDQYVHIVCMVTTLRITPFPFIDILSHVPMDACGSLCGIPYLSR